MIRLNIYMQPYGPNFTVTERLANDDDERQVISIILSLIYNMHVTSLP